MSFLEKLKIKKILKQAFKSADDPIWWVFYRSKILMEQ